MKIDGNGQAKILSSEELRLLFSDGLQTPRDRALFGVCFYTACRISEALALKTADICNGTITFRKAVTKGKLKTRIVDVQPELAALLADYSHSNDGLLFAGVRGVTDHLTRDWADKLLREACLRVSLRGVSTHSFRRTALTMMNNAGIPLRTIREISGHSSLDALQLYLEVSEDQRRSASAAIRF